MIDTIALTLPSNQYNFIKEMKHSVGSGAGFSKRVFNPTKEQFNKHGYLPRATEIRAIRAGGQQTFLKIEFSIPKLLYGNNFQEVNNDDFQEIVDALWQKVMILGIHIIDKDCIENADVSSIHYSKNVVLKDYSTPYSFLEDLKKVNINKLFDINQTDFRNEGHAVKYHSNSFEVIMYDKLRDLEQAKKSRKRAIEQDNGTQLNLFEEYKPKSPFEVLRLEVRIGNRRKLSQLLKKHGFEDRERNFKNMFDVKISQKILLSIVEGLENNYPRLLKSQSKTLKDFIIDLQINNPKLKYGQVLKYVGAKALLDELGTRNFRAVTERFGATSWYRLNTDMKELRQGKREDVFTTIKDSLRNFKQLRLE